MRLLFDQNISYRLVKRIQDIFPDSKQVREVGLEEKSDREIWNYAKEQGFTIVTFDADFFDINLLYGFPPKIIWLRIGNTHTDNLIELLKEKKTEIIDFISSNDTGCLEVYRE